MPSPRWIAPAVLAFSGLCAAPLDLSKAEAVSALVAGLADESYRVRVESTRDLWEMGEKALPELRRAVTSEDPEIAMRAKDLLRKIELGILPDSSPEIVELVMRYDEGSPQVRRQVVERLRHLRAWRQLLKIHEMERDRATLNLIEGELAGVALDAAREALAAEPQDIKGALAYLEMARPGGPAEWMAAAAIHRIAGTLDKELAKIPANAKGELQVRRYTLLAAAGRIGEAAAAAEAAGLEVTAAQLRLLEGDPLPWLKVAPVPEDTMAAPGLGDYREFAARRWKGGEARPGDVRKFRRLAEAGDEEEQQMGMGLLYLTGDNAHADNLLAARFPMYAFEHFESAERIDEALAAIGLDAAQPDYAAWAAKRFRVLIHEEEEKMGESEELAMMAGFMAEHGLHEELREAFLPGLKEMAEGNADQFISTSTSLFHMGATGVVLEALPAYAKEEDALWHQLVSGYFGRAATAAEFWEWLGILRPELSFSQRFEWMATLRGYLPDRDGRVEAFFGRAWPALEAMNEADRERYLSHLLVTGPTSGSMEHYVEAIARFQRIADARKSGNPYATPAYAMCLGALGRWREAADLWLGWVRQSPEKPEFRVYASACLRRAGAEEEADAQARMAEYLALADPELQNSCASAFALAGDFERAGRWWLRAAVEATTPEAFASSFRFSGPLLMHAREVGDWKLAAALSEADALQSVIAGSGNISFFLYGSAQRLNADMARAFVSLDRDREGALELLGRIHRQAGVDGALADYFYPTLREKGLKAQHDKWFGESWALLEKLISRFPAGDNLRNTAAWTASRANRRLDEAEAHLEKALEFRPNQAAYLDTMGEIWFARRDRAKAVEWSEKAVRHGLLDDLRRGRGNNYLLVRQYERFKRGGFPAP